MGGRPEPRFEEHLRRLRPRLDSLQRQGEDRADVLALLAVETFHRPPWRRGAEYLVWAAWSLAAPERLERLSVGPAQVQLRHWRDFGLIAGVRLTPRRLATVRNWPSNARVIRAFLAARGALEGSDVESLTRLYTGSDRPGFAPRLAVARAAIRGRSGR